MKRKGLIGGIIGFVVAIIMVMTGIIYVPGVAPALASPPDWANGVGNIKDNENNGNGNGSTHQHNHSHHNNFNNHHNTVIIDCPEPPTSPVTIDNDIEVNVNVDVNSGNNGTSNTHINGNCSACSDGDGINYLYEFPNNIPVIAIIDTGIDKWHPELRGLVVAEKSFVGASPFDNTGHGTHIAGIIAAKDDGIGITGVAAGYPLINAKVSENGLCKSLDIAKAIMWSIAEGATVINISCELTKSCVDLDAAIEFAIDKGVVVVAAAGNGGSDVPTYPACIDGVIAVGAVNADGELWRMSNYGDWVDTYANGCDIYSTIPGGEYDIKSGTSFATAYITGLMAIAQH